MWFTVLFFLAGVPLGYAVRGQAWAVKLTDMVSVWAVRTLLFLLGLTLGANDELFAQLDTLGVQAAVVAVSAVMGSLVGVRWLGHKLRLDAAMDARAAADRAERQGPKPDAVQDKAEVRS